MFSCWQHRDMARLIGSRSIKPSSWAHTSARERKARWFRCFESAEGYYSTLFHELTHSTGHKSRLNRFEENSTDHQFGSESYSKEELIAEMGAAMLAGMAGISQVTLSNSASYLQSWIKRLKSDSRLIISAASHAQKAADYILGKTEGAGSECQ
jgi:antirestriction protein ArdC